MSWLTFSTPCWASTACPTVPSPLATCLRVWAFRGALTMCSSAWFCHRQTANAIPSAIPPMIRRVAQLLEVVDEAEAILVADRSYWADHSL